MASLNDSNRSQYDLHGLDMEATSGQGCRRLREKAGGNLTVFEPYKTYSGAGTNVFHTIECYPAFSFTLRSALSRRKPRILRQPEGMYNDKNR